MEATTWQHPDQVILAAPFEAPAMSGCDQLDFSPTIEAKPTTNLADSPSGLDVHVHVPQNQDAEGSASAHLREVRIELPAGLDVNPSAANGLGTCTPGQIGLAGLANERQLLRYDLPPVNFSGSFIVSFDGQSTAPISATAPRAQVVQALETLPGLAGNVSVGGAQGGWIVTFTGALAGTDVPLLTGTVTDNPSQKIAVTGEGGTFTLEIRRRQHHRTALRRLGRGSPGGAAVDPRARARQHLPRQRLRHPRQSRSEQTLLPGDLRRRPGGAADRR